MLVKQRFPNFVEVDPTQIPVYNLSTLEELHNIDFVNAWSQDDNFVKFQYSKVDTSTELLMAIMKEKWWVIAYGREGSFADLGLSEWVSPCS